ncbi:MAG: hypothetical protein E7384_06235 [Ruminococcaceae bacterium]|nr:hypothetical protein [Oscillospiraceae bacterium]
MKKTEYAASKDAAISPKKERKSDIAKKNVLIMQIVMVSVIDLVVALLIYAVACLVCGGINESCMTSYFTVLFLPLISFLTAFASFLFTKKLSVSFVVNVILTAVMYLIFNGFEWNIFLWELLYIINAVLGYVIALAVRSYKA